MIVYEREYFDHDAKEWKKELNFYEVRQPIVESKYQKPLVELGRYSGGFPIIYPLVLQGRIINEGEYVTKYSDD